MPEIVIKITDQIDLSAIQKLGQIKELGKEASQSIDKLRESMSGLSSEQSKNKSSADDNKKTYDSYFGSIERTTESLYSVIEASKKFNSEQQKTAQILKQSRESFDSYMGTITNGRRKLEGLGVETVSGRNTGKSGLSESLAFREQQRANLEDKISSELSKQLSLKVAINNLKETERIKAEIEGEKRVADNIQKQLNLKVAINNLKNTQTAKIALGDGGGAVGTGFGAISTGEIIRHNEAVAKSTSLYILFGTVIRTIRLAQYAIDLAKSSDTYILINNRLRLVSGSLKETHSLYEDLRKVANDTRVPIEDLAKSFVRFDYALKPLGATQRESIRFTKTFSEQLQISGLAVQEQSSALLQMSQALNKGKLDGDEFRTIMETLPTVADAIAKEMGVARGELIKLAPEGKITAEVIRNAMASIATETDEAFKKTGITVEQALTLLKTNALDLVGKFNESTRIFYAFGASIKFVAENLAVLAPLATVIAAEFTTTLFPSIVAGAAMAGNALAATLLNPLFLIPAAVTGAYLVFKKFYDDTTTLQDEETARNNAKYDAFKLAQEKRIKQFTYETEAIIKLKTDYAKYLDFLAETNKGVRSGVISETTKQIILQETEIGKILQKSKELSEYSPKKIITDNEKLKKEVEETKSLFDRNTADLENARQAKELIHKKTLEDLRKASQDNSAFAARISEAEQKLENTRLKGSFNKDDKAIEKQKLDADKLAYEKSFENIQQLTTNQRLESDTINDLTNRIKTNNKVRDDAINLLKKESDLEAIARKNKFDAKLKEDEAIDRYQKRIIAIKAEQELKRSELSKSEDFNPEEKLQRLERINNVEIKLIDEVNAEKLKANEKEIAADDKRALNAINGYIKVYQAWYKEFERQQKLLEKQRADEAREVEERNKQSEKAQGVLDSGLKTNASGVLGSISNEIDDDKKRAQELRDANKTLYLNQKTDLEEYEKKAQQIKDFYAQKDKLRAISVSSAILGFASNTFEALSELAKKRQGEESKTARNLFLISKAFALAQAVLDLNLSIAKANTVDPYVKPAALAQAYSTGIVAISGVIGSSLQALAGGGTVGGTGSTTSDSNLVWLSKGEEVIKESVASPNRSFLKGLNDGTINSDNLNRTFSNQVEQGQRSAPKITIVNNYKEMDIKIEHDNSDGQDNFIVMLDRIDNALAKRASNEEGNLSKVNKSLRARGY